MSTNLLRLAMARPRTVPQPALLRLEAEPASRRRKHNKSSTCLILQTKGKKRKQAKQAHRKLQ